MARTLRRSSLSLALAAAVPIALAALSLSFVEAGRMDAVETLESVIGFGLVVLVALQAGLATGGAAARRAWWCGAALLAAAASDDTLSRLLLRALPAAGADTVPTAICAACGLGLVYALGARLVDGMRALLLLMGFVLQAITVLWALHDVRIAAFHLPFGLASAEVIEPLEQVSLGCYLLGMLGVLHGTFADVLVADRFVPQMPPLLRRLAGSLSGLAHSSPGRRLRIAIENLRLARWRTAHPGAAFATYYAGTIEGSLRAGQPHRTLGVKRWRRSALTDESRQWDRAAFRRRSLDLFERLRDEGIRPSDRCIDYGCGSLRVGQHFIRYLDRGCYVGLDVSAYFFTLGRDMIEPEVIADKQPLLTLITDAVIDNLADDPPDWVISTSVLMHVPPSETAQFFDRICRLVGPRTRLIVTFDCADQVLRTAPKAWAYPADLVASQICARLPAHVVVVTAGEELGHIGRSTWRRATAVLRPAKSFEAS